MESGAALRAKTISAFRSGIRYSLSAAMLEYEVLDCACICELAPSVTTSTELANPISLNVLRSINVPLSARIVGRSECCDAAFSLSVVSIIPTSMYVPTSSVQRRETQVLIAGETLLAATERPAIRGLPLVSGFVPGAATQCGRTRFFGLIPSAEDPANSYLKRRTPPTPRSRT